MEDERANKGLYIIVNCRPVGPHILRGSWLEHWGQQRLSHLRWPTTGTESLRVQASCMQYLCGYLLSMLQENLKASSDILISCTFGAHALCIQRDLEMRVNYSW